MLTENRSEIPNAAFGHDGDNFTSRNPDLDSSFKPPIVEDPEEESKSDRNIQMKAHDERDAQQYATIAENLPASATEIDPNPQIKPEEDYRTAI